MPAKRSRRCAGDVHCVGVFWVQRQMTLQCRGVSPEGFGIVVKPSGKRKSCEPCLLKCPVGAFALRLHHAGEQAILLLELIGRPLRRRGCT